MFSNYARGDLIQYLTSEGYSQSRMSTEKDIDLRAAASLHAQSVAMQRSPLFLEVIQYAQQALRKSLYSEPIENTEQADDGYGHSYDGYDEIF